MSKETRIKEEQSKLRDLFVSLGIELLSSDEKVVTIRYRDAEWLRDGLTGLGVAARVSSGTVEIEPPKNEEAYRHLASSLKTVLAPEAVVFDVDDTLADVTESYRRATVATAEAFGARVTYDDITEAKAAGDANNDWELTWRLVRDRGIDVSIEEVTDKFEELYQGTDEKPGLRAKETLISPPGMIERLAARTTLGIVTGRPRKDAFNFLEAQGLRKFFKVVVTMDDGPLKPDPTPCRLALERLEIERAWMVGDTPDDIRSARGAGMLPLGVIAPADNPEVARSALLEAGAGRVLTRISNIEELLP
ncbi:MAG: TIGR01548 family HAD-type hydrolase [Deltaproteobacteria bacterium]|nr:TIGR01548 family HAD-type hydrolase [Deltaproteobacteria bacterium]